MNDHELLRRKALRRFLAFLSLCTALMVAGGFVSVFVYGETRIALPLVLAVFSAVGLMVTSYVRWDDWFPYE